jgi:HSP20 family protein
MEVAMKNENLTVWNNPFGLLRRLTADMENYFDESAMGRLIPSDFHLFKEARWMPSVDVFEKDGHFTVRADLPGLTKKDVNVEVTENGVTIKGERRKELEEEKEGVYRHERAFGSFYRSFPLPEGIKAEDVKATFNNGVLEVTVPLPPAKKELAARHVEVQEVTGEKVKAA